MDYYQIGQRIRHFRKAQGLSQAELAEAVGISITHMSHIETGNTKLSLPVLVDLAVTLHVTTDELLFATPATPKPIAQETIRAVLETCSPPQAQIIAAIVQSTKTALEQYQ